MFFFLVGCMLRIFIRKMILIVAPILAMACVASANANVYMGLSPFVTSIKVEGQRLSPIGAGLQLGYGFDERHSVDFLYVEGIKEDELNSLELGVSPVMAATYRFNFMPQHGFKVGLILGASQFDVEQSLPQQETMTETYQGFVYGLAFEECFHSMPELKVTAEIMSLYTSDDMNVLGASLGVRYEF